MTVASGKSLYLAKKLADEVLGGVDFTPPANVYLGLVTVAGVNGAAGTAATGTGYTRKALVNDNTVWTAASGSTTPASKVNAATITMATAGADWSSAANMVGWEIWDAASSGNLLYYGPLDTPAPVLSGNTPTFAAGAIVVSLQ